MIFRLSVKLNAKIKTGTLATLALDENPFADMRRTGWRQVTFRPSR